MKFNAITMKYILLGALLATLISVGVVIYFAKAYLTAEATKTVRKKIDVELSNTDIDRLKRLQTVLEENRTSVNKTAEIVSNSKQYQYQDQIVQDINSFAAKTGVKVKGYDFGASSTTPQAANPKLPQITGVKSLPVTISLESPLPFDNYLKFVKAIETNLTKMQISGVNLTPDSDNINNVINPTVELIVFVK